MISDARALRPEFIPRDMIHREGSIEHMAAVLDPLAGSENVSIFGASGCGKTTLAKYVLSKVEASRLDFRWAYVNAMSESTKAGVLHRVVENSRLGRDIRRTGTPIGLLLDRIREFDGTLAVVLDEVDLLDDPDTIAVLADMPSVSIITICIDEDKLHANLRTHERVRSRLRSCESITLSRYTHAQLRDILWYRVDHGFDGDRVEEHAIETIADRAAGNARIGIALLRQAARHVHLGHSERLTEEIIGDISTAAHTDVRERRVRYLGTHKRALYDIIKTDDDGISASELHARYESRVQEPKTRRTRRRYLDSLERYDLIQSEGRNSGRRYRTL